MRALAWWRATPEPAETSRAKADKKKRVSRIRDAEERGLEIFLPDVEPDVLYLVDTLLDAGPTSAAGMGFVPVTWTDLEAWSRVTGIELLPWEARLVRQLSAEWLAETDRSRSAKAPPPWEHTEESALTRVAEDMRSRIAQLAET